MTQAVNEATEPLASNEAHEAEDSKGFCMPQELSSIHHSNLEKPGLKGHGMTQALCLDMQAQGLNLSIQFESKVTRES